VIVDVDHQRLRRDGATDHPRQPGRTRPRRHPLRRREHAEPSRTSTYALTNATIKYVVTPADHGLEKAVTVVPHMVTGINVSGTVPHSAVAEALGAAYAVRT
jgi:hypothetical protein